MKMSIHKMYREICIYHDNNISPTCTLNKTVCFFTWSSVNYCCLLFISFIYLFISVFILFVSMASNSAVNNLPTCHAEIIAKVSKSSNSSIRSSQALSPSGIDGPPRPLIFKVKSLRVSAAYANPAHKLKACIALSLSHSLTPPALCVSLLLSDSLSFSLCIPPTIFLRLLTALHCHLFTDALLMLFSGPRHILYVNRAALG